MSQGPSRERSASAPPSPLPPLDTALRELLKAWARDDAPSRRWTALLAPAGPAGIEDAHRLAEILCQHGWAALKETHVKGSWRLDALRWTDLTALKASVGLDSRPDRLARRASALAALAAWADHEPDLRGAVEALAANRTLTAERLAERRALLEALVTWRNASRSGVRRDFELAARQRTKSLTDAEWRWLQDHVDLSAFGIESFAPLVWLSGPLSLTWDGGRPCDLHALEFVGLTADRLGTAGVSQAPERYWLIENRASFERQAAQRAAGVAVVWLPGRPSWSWQAAVAHLLDVAPAPAWISADPDPAGIEIALTAGDLWDARGLAWTPWRMGVDELAAAVHSWPLDGDHDVRVLARLAERAGLPEPLADLCRHMRRHGRKAEQEGWL